MSFVNILGYVELHSHYMEYKTNLEIEMANFDDDNSSDLSQMGTYLKYMLLTRNR